MKTIAIPSVLLSMFLCGPAAGTLPAQDPGKSAAKEKEQSNRELATQELIEQLGDADYEVRKAAENRLLARGKTALEELKRSAEKHADPEVQWRAGRLVRRIEAGETGTDKGLAKRDRADAPPSRDRGLRRTRSGGSGGLSDEHKRILEEVQRSLDRAFDGPEFDRDVRREIEKAMKDVQEKLRGMSRFQFDMDFPGLQSKTMRSSNSKSMKMSQGPDGVRVEISEKGEDGEPKVKVYEAPDMETFREKYPGVLGDDGAIRIRIGDEMRKLEKMFGDDFPFKDSPLKKSLRPRLFRDERRDGDAEPPKADRKRLGFHVGEISPAVRDYLELDGGLLVDSVVDGSLAAKLGLRQGDIVVRVGKKKVYQPDDVADALEAIGDGKVTVDVIRKGRATTLGK